MQYEEGQQSTDHCGNMPALDCTGYKVVQLYTGNCSNNYR